MSRRVALQLSALFATSVARPSAAGASGLAFRVVDLRFDSAIREARVARLLIPNDLELGAEARLLILLHGYGAVGSERRGLEAWQSEYDVEGAYQRLRRPPLVNVSAAGCLTETRCAELNGELARQPFRGLVLACPLTPSPYYRPQLIRQFGAFLSDELLPAAKATLGVADLDVGVAGVSMGGRVGLELLAERPDAFHAFVGLQSHVERHEVERYAERIAGASTGTNRPRLLLQTTTLDPYLAANQALSRALSRRKLDHELRVSPGLHTASWVRNAGAIEALFWHDRTLGSEVGGPRVAAAAGT